MCFPTNPFILNKNFDDGYMNDDLDDFEDLGDFEDLDVLDDFDYFDDDDGYIELDSFINSLCY